MKWKCSDCGNTESFTAEAQATIQVTIDGDGKLKSTRPFQQPYKDVEIHAPWKCNSCGSVGRILEESEPTEPEVN